MNNKKIAAELLAETRTPTRGMKIQADTRRDESATSVSSNDYGSSTSEIIAPSPKRFIKTKTPDNMKETQQPTRKSGRVRQSTLA